MYAGQSADQEPVKRGFAHSAFMAAVPAFPGVAVAALNADQSSITLATQATASLGLAVAGLNGMIGSVEVMRNRVTSTTTVNSIACLTGALATLQSSVAAVTPSQQTLEQTMYSATIALAFAGVAAFSAKLHPTLSPSGVFRGAALGATLGAALTFNAITDAPKRPAVPADEQKPARVSMTQPVTQLPTNVTGRDGQAYRLDIPVQ
jgi:hypothetical protein